VIDAYLVKGRVLDEKMARPDKAAQHYERCLATDPNQPEALLRLAELALRRQDLAQAGGFAQRGLELVTLADDRRRAPLLLCRAAARRGSGDDGAAKADLEEARRVDAGLA